MLVTEDHLRLNVEFGEERCPEVLSNKDHVLPLGDRDIDGFIHFGENIRRRFGIKRWGRRQSKSAKGMIASTAAAKDFKLGGEANV